MNYNATDILTLTEIAHYLKLADRTVLKMVHNNEIPCLKIANQWRFIKPVVDDWLRSKLNFLPEKNSDIHNGFDIRVSRLIKQEFLLSDIKKGTKRDVIGQLIAPLLNNNLIDNKDFLLHKLLEREEMLPTSIGNGFAVPHVREINDNPVKQNYLVMGICEDGTDFGAWDNKLTHVFLLVGTINNVIHLKLLSQIAQIFYDSMLIDKILSDKNISSILTHVLKKEYEVMVGNN